VLGCDLAQGFHLSKPMAHEAFAEGITAARRQAQGSSLPLAA